MKDIKKRLKRAICLLQDPRGSTIKSIFKVVNEDKPAVKVQHLLKQLFSEVDKGNLIAKDGRFKLRDLEEDDYEDYEFEDIEKDDDEDYEDEEDEEDGLEDYMDIRDEMDGDDLPENKKDKDNGKDDDSKKLETQKTESEDGSTVAQPYEAKCYPCTKKRKRSSCPKKRKKACPTKRKRAACPKKRKPSCPKKKRSSCPKAKKRHSCPKKRKPSCPKKKPSCPKKKPSCPKQRKPKKCGMNEHGNDNPVAGGEEGDREVNAPTAVASFNSFNGGSRTSLRNRVDRVDLKKQIRRPRCTSMKKEIRLPSRVQLPLVNPVTAPQKTHDELARRSPPISPLFDDNREMIVDPERILFPKCNEI